MGQSRTELVAFVNELLQLNYTKIEQCGTGAAYCQIIDSIYQNVPMSKVKMAARQEWEYLENFKILTTAFKNNGVEKPIPVQGLVKCKMQDNLEFLQWLKTYWDTHFPGGEYDPVARRKGAKVAPLGGAARSAKSPVNAPSSRTVSASMASKRPAGAGGFARTSASGGSRSASTVPDPAVQQLTAQLEETKLGLDGLEKERDFYFAKLRDIEIIVGARLESPEEALSETEKDTLLQIQTILYSTEEGFEVPDEEGVPAEDDEETF